MRSWRPRRRSSAVHRVPTSTWSSPTRLCRCAACSWGRAKPASSWSAPASRTARRSSWTARRRFRTPHASSRRCARWALPARRRHPAPPVRRIRRRAPPGREREPLPPVHRPARGDVAPDGGDRAGRHRGLSAAARRRAPAGRLPDDPGRHVLSGGEPRRHGLGRHRAARAAIRPAAGPQADDVGQLERLIDRDLAVRSGALHRRRRAAGAGGHQCGRYVPAPRPSEPTRVQQGQPGANLIEVVDRVKQLLPQLQSALPTAVQVTVLTDRTTTIRASVHDVQFELMLAVVLVVLVIFVFLRSAAATFIPGITGPGSIVGTFAVMYGLGFSLNNLSLMALTISTGFVVDDAVVMIENIIRYLEEGESPLQAAFVGSGQIGFTILSLTVSLIAVLIPLLFMGDIVGRLFREFALTLSAAILVSAVVSLTLTPMLFAKLLQPVADRRA